MAGRPRIFDGLINRFAGGGNNAIVRCLVIYNRAGVLRFFFERKRANNDKKKLYELSLERNTDVPQPIYKNVRHAEYYVDQILRTKIAKGEATGPVTIYTKMEPWDGCGLTLGILARQHPGNVFQIIGNVVYNQQFNCITYFNRGNLSIRKMSPTDHQVVTRFIEITNQKEPEEAGQSIQHITEDELTQFGAKTRRLLQNNNKPEEEEEEEKEEEEEGDRGGSGDEANDRIVNNRLGGLNIDEDNQG